MVLGWRSSRPAGRAEPRAQLEFDMPRVSGADPALVIEAMHGDAKGHLRFQLKARPKVPAAS